MDSLLEARTPVLIRPGFLLCPQDLMLDEIARAYIAVTNVDPALSHPSHAGPPYSASAAGGLTPSICHRE